MPDGVMGTMTREYVKYIMAGEVKQEVSVKYCLME